MLHSSGRASNQNDVVYRLTGLPFRFSVLRRFPTYYHPWTAEMWSSSISWPTDWRYVAYRLMVVWRCIQEYLPYNVKCILCFIYNVLRAWCVIGTAFQVTYVFCVSSAFCCYEGKSGNFFKCLACCSCHRNDITFLSYVAHFQCGIRSAAVTISWRNISHSTSGEIL